MGMKPTYAIWGVLFIATLIGPGLMWAGGVTLLAVLSCIFTGASVHDRIERGPNRRELLLVSDVNIPLLRKAVEWVEEQAALPEIDREWRQEFWRTSPLESAQRLVEYTPLVSHLGDVQRRHNVTAQVASHCGTAFCVAGYIGQMHDERYKTSYVVDGIHVAKYAADLLGIEIPSWYERGPVSVPLFNGFNSAADVRRLAEELAGERL